MIVTSNINFEEFNNRKEVFNFFIEKYNREVIPEEIFEFWKIDGESYGPKQWHLYPNGNGSAEETSAVLLKYDWPQSIRLQNNNDHGHITWKCWLMKNPIYGESPKPQLMYHRLCAPARIQIKRVTPHVSQHTSIAGYNKDFSIRDRWYVNGQQLKTENDIINHKLILLDI